MEAMKKILMTTLRNRETNMAAFRHAAGQMAEILAAEVADFLACEEVSVKTPIAEARGWQLQHDIILVPILRSGLALLPAFSRNFESARVGCIGLKRDEVTAIPNLYYKNLPTLSPSNDVIVLDPMIATGGSGTAAIEVLINEGVPEAKIVFVGVISSPQGLQAIRDSFPKVMLIVACEDQGLNDKKFITPGLGDFGDRYFGTVDERRLTT